MKNRLLSIFFLLMFLAACAPQTGSTPVQAKSTPTSILAATQTAPVPTLTAISTTPTLSPKPIVKEELTEECITIEQKLPDDLKLSGVWVINEGKPYLENLADHMVYEVPLKGRGIFSTYDGDSAISPDGTHLAYIDNYYDANDRLEKRILRVMRSSGHSLDMSYWVQNWQWIIGWVDDQNLALSTPKGGVVVLNPITGVWHEFKHPGEKISDDFSYWDAPNYSPTLEWVISRPDYSEMILKSTKTDQIVWQTKDAGWSGATWATKNIILAAPSNTGVIVLRNNQQEEKFNFSKFGYGYPYYLKISPDGQKLAFDSSKDYQSQPTIMDLEKHKLARLCADNISSWGRPAWSPDSRFVIQYVYDSHYQSFDILIDTQTMRAYLLNSGYYQHRIAWLAQP